MIFQLELDLYHIVAIFQLELETGTSRTRLVKVTIFQLELETCTSCARLEYYKLTKLRFSSWSWKPVLRALDLHFKDVIFQKPVLRELDLRYKVAIFQLELDF